MTDQTPVGYSSDELRARLQTLTNEKAVLDEQFLKLLQETRAQVEPGIPDWRLDLVSLVSDMLTRLNGLTQALPELLAENNRKLAEDLRVGAGEE